MWSESLAWHAARSMPESPALRKRSESLGVGIDHSWYGTHCDLRRFECPAWEGMAESMSGPDGWIRRILSGFPSIVISTPEFV